MRRRSATHRGKGPGFLAAACEAGYRTAHGNMCQYCTQNKLRGEPTLTKTQILDPKTAGLTGSNKPWIVIVGHATDEEDGATKLSQAKTHAEGRGYRVINQRPQPKSGAAFGEFRGNSSGGKLVVRVECHGAPGWTMGADGTFQSEVEGAWGLKYFVCSLQQSLGRAVDAITFQSCYSAVEYAGGSGAAFLLASARIASIVLDGIYVIGFLGEDNGTTLVAHLEKEDGEATSLSTALGTVGFFKGKSQEGTPNDKLYAKIKPQAVRDELRQQCSVNLTRLPLTFVDNERLCFMRNRVLVSITPPKAPGWV